MDNELKVRDSFTRGSWRRDVTKVIDHGVEHTVYKKVHGRWIMITVGQFYSWNRWNKWVESAWPSANPSEALTDPATEI